MTEAPPDFILAIETSCDETAVAVADARGGIFVSRVASQIELHAPHGGVVPELASRNHSADLKPLIQATMEQGGMEWKDISAVAATSGPGLASSLLIGDTTAKAMAAALDCPFYSINHMEGHLLSPFIQKGILIPEHIALVVSGGHTLLVKVGGVGDYEVMGSTKDDAAGEAFDKVGKLLGLAYPGGPEIAKHAAEGDSARFDFPRSMLDSGDNDFSFSGLKTSARYLIEKLNQPLSETDLNDICASFQEAVVDVLVGKLQAAAKQYDTGIIAVSGGVSCNRRLRERCAAMATAGNLELEMAEPAYSTDNAAMIAFAAAARRAAGMPGSPLNTDINPNLRLGSLP
ncbi:MAG: tRNA (adenosine(37)-N6)-threonylcarbamoyltransferase complex transferase subunit TsaD [Verrucomicrobiales bacterium]|nr:tRNA (adenosine(37)-N6)-threonylcarbamoyltransferase complex transferase subunit TsaD [Verrucomicrobiales bacterium]